MEKLLLLRFYIYILMVLRGELVLDLNTSSVRHAATIFIIFSIGKGSTGVIYAFFKHYEALGKYLIENEDKKL